ncbi:helix-turn-helix domain-containing protein [Streptococcus sobrinus]|uniref:helix-turn-helix domain-containing protein n=2 Tax=Streptococcus sobrinus TaxID=1310 RepID=UPI00030E5AAA|nr:helix-turn-helix transcriptional regulator [Streptococcus sobrinus]
MTVLSDRIKEMRVDSGKSKEQVATYLAVELKTYSRYETGERKPDIEKLVQLADYFYCSVDYLLGRDVVANVDTISRDQVYSYRDLCEKGYNGKLSHGLIKQIYDSQCYNDRVHVTGDDTIKYVRKTDVQKLLEQMADEL